MPLTNDSSQRRESFRFLLASSPSNTNPNNTSWVVTAVGGTAFVAASTAAVWMAYTQTTKTSRLVSNLSSLSPWFRSSSGSSSSSCSSKSLSSSAATNSTTAASAAKPQQQQTKSYYLDYNGTTPVYPEVFDAMAPYLKEHFGNPSSSHLFGTEPRRGIETARKQILTQLLGVSVAADDNKSNGNDDTLDLSAVWFTGCGTESDNLAIRLALLSSPSTSTSGSGSGNSHHGRPKHIVTCNVEHPAIENYLVYLEQQNNTNNYDVVSSSGGIRVTRVPVDEEGRVSARDVLAAITPDTVLVTLMLANNESGALQPVREVAEECRRRGVLCHTDAAQAAGKVSIHLSEMGNPDMVTIVGHKIGAPKGIAALYVRPGCLNEKEHGRVFNNANNNNNTGVLLIGGGQEFGRRGGTENTPYIVGLGKAAEMAQTNLERNASHTEGLRNRLLGNLRRLLGTAKVRVNGPNDPKQRLPNTLSVGLDGVRSGELLASVGHVVAASAGAACHSSCGSSSISSVLLAMNVPESFARGTLRLSVGPGTTSRDIDEASELIARAARSQWEEQTDGDGAATTQ